MKYAIAGGGAVVLKVLLKRIEDSRPPGAAAGWETLAARMDRSPPAHRAWHPARGAGHPAGKLSSGGPLRYRSMLVVLLLALLRLQRAVGSVTTLTIGRDGGTTVYIIDGFMGEDDARKVRRRALSCSFSWAQHSYPGMWCRSRNTKDLASVYTDKVNAQLEDLGVAIEFDGRDSFFGVVMNRSLADFSRAPHIDFHSAAQCAAVHYLFDGENASSPSGGTAFFRDRSTGIERFRSAAQCRDSEGGGDGVGICEHFGSDLIKVPYMSRDNPWYESLRLCHRNSIVLFCTHPTRSTGLGWTSTQCADFSPAIATALSQRGSLRGD